VKIAITYKPKIISTVVLRSGKRRRTYHVPLWTSHWRIRSVIHFVGLHILHRHV